MKRPGLTVLPTLLLLLVFAGWAEAQEAAAEPDQAQQEPLDVDLIERVERRLTQLDVTIRPKKKKDDFVPPELNVDDFEVVVVGKRVELKYADRVCRAVPGEIEAAPEEAETETAVAQPPSPPPAAAAVKNTYVFYFDHTHLTMAGQATALSMAESLIPELISGGNLGMVVSSGGKMEQSKLTDSASELLDFIHEVGEKKEQWLAVAYAEGEENRYNDILRAQEFSPDAAKNQAKMYLREERMYTRRQLTRFSATLAALGDLDPPKAVLYFADIMRSNPGWHYARFVGLENSAELANLADETTSFDRVTEAAGAHGVRLYTIQAEGLKSGMPGVGMNRRSNGIGSVEASRLPWERVNDAVRTMQSFALESGGEMFYGGTERSTMSKVLNRIQADLSCFYLLSFHSDNLKEDAPLPIRVRFNQDSPQFAELDQQYEIQSRGQITVLSEARKKESLLLAAHAVSETVDSETGRGAIIPLGFQDGRYHGLVQFTVGNPDLPEALVRETSWELGMTHVHRQKVENQIDRRVTIPDPRIPVVLQASWTFPPGENEIVSVGYEDRLGQLVTAELERDWPDPDLEAATVTKVALVQPESAVFVGAEDEGEGAKSRVGSLAVGDGAARVDRPLYFISLVCRKKRDGQALWIDRALVGNVTVDFTLQQWDRSEDERCVLIQDLIRENQVGWGDFEYRVRVFDDPSLEEDPIVTQVRKFTAVDPGEFVETSRGEEYRTPGQPGGTPR